MSGNGTVRVRVVVLEDGMEVDMLEIGYFEQQQYTVQIVTPDGVDKETEEHKAGVE